MAEKTYTKYLQELGEQLQQAKETSELGKALASRNYSKAGQELGKMKLGDKSTAQQRQSLEKLAARIGETEKSMSSSRSGSRRDAQEMSREISKMLQEQKKTGQCSSQCKSCMNQSIGKNCKSMQALAARKKANQGLEQFRKKLQNCQSCMKSGTKPGGKGAGSGVDRSFRPPQPQSLANGQMEQLSGQLGEGESQKEIMNADSGGGTASGGDAEKAAVEYQQKLEAFVRREDIPEEMKHGVKTYFEQIHTLEKELNQGVE